MTIHNIKMNNQTRGVFNGIVSGISFGLIPLFSIPVIAAGMDNVSILVYRYLFGSAAMFVVLVVRKTDIRISFSMAWRIVVLAALYTLCSVTTLESYQYLSSGIATALVYTDPVWCAIIGIAFLGEKFSWRISSSIVLASLGVMMMTGVFSQDGSFSLIGLVWGLASGIFYALYLILVPRLKVKDIPSLKLTFYVFFVGMILLSVYGLATRGNIQTATDSACWYNLLMLGLIPTALSNICVTMSLKLINSTIVAILGAFEPLTAMAVGIIILGEPCSVLSIMGASLILISVGILTILPKLRIIPNKFQPKI